jgi:hypothetical protein
LQPDETKTIGKIESKNDPLAVERQAMENGLVQARFSLGRVEYHLAQTYEDPKSPERIDLLKAAEKSFGDIYQQYRQSTEDERCIVALLWQGQTLVDLGEEQTAMEIFDEVLVRDTDGSDSSLAPIFTQATLSRYTAMRKLGKLDEMVAEAAKWVELHKGWTKYPAFNAVVLDLGKAYQAQAEREVADKQKKILQKAAILLADFSKNDNPYKSEMLLLRRDILKQLGTEGVGAAEFLALGDAALQENRIDEARKDFEQARQKSLDAKDPKGVEDAKRAMSRADLKDAQNLFEKRKYEDSLQAAKALAEGDAADPTTIGAAELALRSAFFLGATSENKEDAYSQLEKTADFVKNKWPGRPVADVARMILAQSQLQKGDAKAALALFAQVKPESSRYPWALYNIAKLHWLSYLEEKRKPDGRDEKSMAQSDAKARESLQKCVDLLQKTLGPGRKLAGEDTEDPAEEAKALQLIADARLLQAEILIEAKEYQKAADLLEPLLERAKTASPESSDTSASIYMAAIRARLGVEESEKAADYAISMLAISEDSAKANSKLVTIARLLNEKLKLAEAGVTEAESGDPQNLEAATAKRDAFKEQFCKLIEPLGKRKEHSLQDLVFLGGICFTLKLTDEGGQIYQNLLDRAKEDPAFAQKSEKALVYARSQLIGVLRSQGKLDEALKQADELIKKNPRVLAPKMTRADILEDLAKKDPKKLDEAIAQWSEIRVLLTRDNPKRPEYFEVIYKISKSLYQQYLDGKDKSKLAPAEQLLQTTLVQYAKLSGPDMVAKYNDLLKKIQDAKGKK